MYYTDRIMKTAFLLFCGMVVFVPGRMSAQTNSITQFYEHVDTVCEFPEVNNTLVLLCQKKLMDRYISFVGFKEDSLARIVAVTLKPLTDVQKNISLIVEFDGGRPTAGKVNTWGYIFDRNGDGKIDYLALVGGAAPCKGVDFPDNYPKRGKPLTNDQLEYMIGHCKTVFNQWADDNYDDTLDAVIHVSMDPERDWVDHRLLIRSKQFNRKFDDVRAFWTNVETQQVPMEHTPTSVPYLQIGKTDEEEFTQHTLDDKTRIVQLINQALKQCKIKSERLMR